MSVSCLAKLANIFSRSLSRKEFEVTSWRDKAWDKGRNFCTFVCETDDLGCQSAAWPLVNQATVRRRKGDIVTILEGAEVRIGFYGRGGRILRGDTPEGAEGPKGWPRG